MKRHTHENCAVKVYGRVRPCIHSNTIREDGQWRKDVSSLSVTIQPCPSCDHMRVLDTVISVTLLAQIVVRVGTVYIASKLYTLVLDSSSAKPLASIVC